MLIATGETVAPSVPSVIDYYGNSELTAIPLEGLPPSDTALVRLRGNEGPKIQAFARAPPTS
jgi:hypothetical protein